MKDKYLIINNCRESNIGDEGMFYIIKTFNKLTSLRALALELG